MTDEATPNLWNGVPFHAGDTVLLEWTDYEDTLGRAMWKVPASLVADDPYYAELSDDDGEGLLINGSENIYPTNLTVLEAEDNPISLDGYQEAAIQDFQVGDSLIAVLTGIETLTLEHVLNSESIRGQKNNQFYNILGVAFSSLDEATFYRKTTS